MRQRHLSPTMKFCADCRQGFMPSGNHQLRCEKCRGKHKRQKTKERVQRHREKQPKPERAAPIDWFQLRPLEVMTMDIHAIFASRPAFDPFRG